MKNNFGVEVVLKGEKMEDDLGWYASNEFLKVLKSS